MRALGALVALALSGCSALETAAGLSVSQDTVDAVRSAYDAGFLVPANNYRSLGYCPSGGHWTAAKPCAERAVVAKLVVADRVVAQDFAQVQTLVAAGSNAQAAYVTLESAVSGAIALAQGLGGGQ